MSVISVIPETGWSPPGRGSGRHGGEQEGDDRGQKKGRTRSRRVFIPKRRREQGHAVTAMTPRMVDIRRSGRSESLARLLLPEKIS
jgi:hypothetical protein